MGALVGQLGGIYQLSQIDQQYPPARLIMMPYMVPLTLKMFPHIDLKMAGSSSEGRIWQDQKLEFGLFP